MLSQENSLVLVIDIQEKLVNALSKNTIVNNAAKIISGARFLDIPVLVTEQYPKGLGSTIHSVKYSVPDSAKFFEKTSFNALLTDGVKEELGEVKNVFIFGIETHICVYQTAMALLQAGYNVFAIKDACASRDSDEFKAGINLMEKEGVKILTVEMVIFEMLKSSKHPNFKEVQAFIK